MAFRSNRGFRGGRGRRSGRPLRPLDWMRSQMSGAAVGGGVLNNWVVLPLDIRDLFTDPTWVRTLMRTSVRTETSPAGEGSIGVGVIEWPARDDTQETAPPLPLTDGDMDWVLRQVFPIPRSLPVGTTFTTELDTMHFSRAMRRLGNDNGILWVAESSPTGPNYSVVSDVRVLLKE